VKRVHYKSYFPISLYGFRIPKELFRMAFEKTCESFATKCIFSYEAVKVGSCSVRHDERCFVCRLLRGRKAGCSQSARVRPVLLAQM